MPSVETLRTLSVARMDDARALLSAGRNEGAIYLCGYAIELALKARICETLGWTRFPDTGREVADYRSLRTHDLDVLLNLSGVRNRILSGSRQDWETVSKWRPELRYAPAGADAELPPAAVMIPAAALLLEAL